MKEYRNEKKICQLVLSRLFYQRVETPQQNTSLILIIEGKSQKIYSG